MSGWLTERLHNFGAGEAKASVLAPPDLSDLTGEAQEPEVSTEYLQGEQAGREAALAEMETRIEAIQAGEAERLAEARAKWIEEQAGPLAEQWKQALAELEGRIGDQVAAVLRPFLDERLRQRALEALGDAIGRLTGADDGAGLRVSGPPDLLDALRPKLEEADLAPELVAYDAAVDVRITAGDTLIETTFAEWRDHLAEDR